jgi:hypothetical protein
LLCKNTSNKQVLRPQQRRNISKCSTLLFLPLMMLLISLENKPRKKIAERR